ncbi:MAG: carbamate kinase [Candidatus Latescibacterota bacterium]|nr:MAG: carbamate kinase [Candidatus Latescibacterota bacterium]
MTGRGDLNVVGLGGNAIIPNSHAGTIEEQRTLTRATMAQVAEQIARGVDVVLTHGNGPIIGNIALRNEALAHEIPPMPLDVCGADSQGGIGYMVQQALQNELHRRGVQRAVVTLVTQVEVDPADPAFGDPTKPIGPYYDLREAERLRQEKGWVLRDDSGRGLRRLVPSPRPKSIVEVEVIRTLVDEGVIVNCVGGGGVPVVRQAGEWVGVEAVIDKDRTATVLATQLRARRIILLTGVETVMRNFRTPSEAPLHRVTPEEAEQLLAAGEFPAGSMGPKIEAALDFLTCGGQEVIITDPEHLSAALSGNTGTHITMT